MNLPQAPRPAVILSGGSEVVSIALVEALAAERVEVIVFGLGIDTLLHGLPMVRRAVRLEWPPTARVVDEIVSELRSQGATAAGTFPVFPTEDGGLRLLAEHRARLSEYLTMPGALALASLGADKAELFELLDGSRLRSHLAPTVGLDEPGAIGAAARELGQDLIVKPAVKPYSVVLGTGRGAAKLLAKTPDEPLDAFIRRAEAVWADAPRWIAQARLPAGTPSERSFCGARFSTGDVAGVTVRNLWKHPAMGGSSCWVETVREPDIEALAREILNEVHQIGPVEVEFILDGNGHWRLIELNPRPWLQIALNEAARAPVVYPSYRDLLGAPAASARQAPLTGTSWLHGERLAVAVASKAVRSPLSAIARAARAFLRADHIAVYSSALPKVRRRWILRMLNRLKPLISGLLAGAALLWIAWLIYRSRTDIAAVFAAMTPMSAGHLVLSVLLAAVGMTIPLAVFRTFLATQSKRVLSWPDLAALFFAAQVVKYLPGRFFGVVYQVNRLRGQFPGGAVVRSNIEYQLFTLAFSTAAAISIIAYARLGPAPAMLAFGAGMALLFVYLRSSWMDRLVVLARRAAGKTPAGAGEGLHRSRRLVTLEAAGILAWSSVSWVFYLAAWRSLVAAFPSIDAGFAELCALYTLSWVIGFVTLLTPGGLGVREAVFVYLSGGMAATGSLALFSVVMRFWLLTVDLLLGMLSIMAQRLFARSAATASIRDRDGLNVLDHNDWLGRKSEYITLVQERALDEFLPPGEAGGRAVDLGCGYGRLTPHIAAKGWDVVGIDPDPTLIETAGRLYPEHRFIEGGLPDLPVAPNSVDLMVVHNVLRSLHLMNKLHFAEAIGRYVTDSGQVYLVDNLRLDHPNYIPEEEIIALFERQGFALRRRRAIRQGRRLVTYLIWAGLIPRRQLARAATAEVEAMGKRGDRVPRHQYYNVLFVFERAGRAGTT